MTPETTIAPSPAKPSPKKMAFWIIGALACFLPVIIILVSPEKSHTTLVYYGVLSVIVGYLNGYKVAIGTAIIMPITIIVSLLASATPITGALFVVALCIGISWSYTKGWEGAAVGIAWPAAMVVIAQPAIHLVPGDQVILRDAFLAATLVLAGGIWAAIMGAIFLRDVPHKKQHFYSREQLMVFAIVSSVIIGFGTFAIMQWFEGKHHWWIVMIMIITINPETHDAAQRAILRLSGTFIGGAGAALFVIFVHDKTILTVVGVTLALAAIVTTITGPFWIYMIFVTSAGIIIGTDASHRLGTDLEKVLFTAIASFIVLGTGVLTRLILQYVSKRSEKSLSQEPTAL